VHITNKLSINTHPVKAAHTTYGIEDVGSYSLDVMHHLPQQRLKVQLRYQEDKMIQTQVQSSLCQISSSLPDLENIQTCGIVSLQELGLEPFELLTQANQCKRTSACWLRLVLKYNSMHYYYYHYNIFINQRNTFRCNTSKYIILPSVRSTQYIS
jgi:hypothetical protein